jgi:hypothetical protein
MESTKTSWKAHELEDEDGTVYRYPAPEYIAAMTEYRRTDTISGYFFSSPQPGPQPSDIDWDGLDLHIALTAYVADWAEAYECTRYLAPGPVMLSDDAASAVAARCDIYQPHHYPPTHGVLTFYRDGSTEYNSGACDTPADPWGDAPALSTYDDWYMHTIGGHVLRQADWIADMTPDTEEDAEEEYTQEELFDLAVDRGDLIAVQWDADPRRWVEWQAKGEKGKQKPMKKTIRLLEKRFLDAYVLYAPELVMPGTPAVAEPCFPAIGIVKTCDPLLTTLPYYILISELGEYEEYRSHPALGYIYAAFGGREKLWQTLLDHARRNPCFRDDVLSIKRDNLDTER